MGGGAVFHDNRVEVESVRSSASSARLSGTSIAVALSRAHDRAGQRVVLERPARQAVVEHRRPAVGGHRRERVEDAARPRRRPAARRRRARPSAPRAAAARPSSTIGASRKMPIRPSVSAVIGLPVALRSSLRHASVAKSSTQLDVHDRALEQRQRAPSPAGSSGTSEAVAEVMVHAALAQPLGGRRDDRRQRVLAEVRAVLDPVLHRHHLPAEGRRPTAPPRGLSCAFSATMHPVGRRRSARVITVAGRSCRPSTTSRSNGRRAHTVTSVARRLQLRRQQHPDRSRPHHRHAHARKPRADDRRRPVGAGPSKCLKSGLG